MTNTSDNSPFRGLGGKVFLIGFMGSGKSYWGNLWSKHHSIQFFDLDEVIEREQQKSVATIFEKEGEKHFRKIEALVLKSFADKNNCIIACGGGTACFNNNMQWMNDNGMTVYLSAPPQYIYDRVFEEKEKRPLLDKLNPAELFFFIEQKLKEREPFYSKAQVILPVEKLDIESLLKFINPNS
jgi:shikimate kinase